MKPSASPLPVPNALRLASRILLAACVVLGCAASSCRPNGVPHGRALRVGMSPGAPPMVFLEKGELVGIEVDLARELAARLGRRPVFVRLASAELLSAVERGEVDVAMSGLAVTPERARRVLFTASYMQAGQLALIRTVDLARFGRVHALRRPGTRVGFEHDSAGERFVADELPRATSFAFDDLASALRSLRAGRIDYLIHDAPTVWRIAGDPEQRDLHALFQLLTSEELAWAVRRKDTGLKSRIDAELAAWQREGGIDPIVERWIPVRVTVR